MVNFEGFFFFLHLYSFLFVDVIWFFFGLFFVNNTLIRFYVEEVKLNYTLTKGVCACVSVSVCLSIFECLTDYIEQHFCIIFEKKNTHLKPMFDVHWFQM